AAARSITGIAASTTSGPMPSPAITATRYGRLLKTGGPAAADAIRPSHVHLGAARRTFELPRGRLAAMRAEIHFSPRGYTTAAVGTVIGLQRVGTLFDLERRVGARWSVPECERRGWRWGRQRRGRRGRPGLGR